MSAAPVRHDAAPHLAADGLPGRSRRPGPVVSSVSHHFARLSRSRVLHLPDCHRNSCHARLHDRKRDCLLDILVLPGQSGAERQGGR